MKNKTFLFLIIILIVIVVLVTFFISFKYFSLREEEILKSIPDDNKSYYKASFSLNGADSIEKKTISCEVKNNECYITMPDAKRDDGVILGFSINENDTTPMYQEKEIVKIREDTTFYVISYKINNVYFADEDIDYLEANKLSCNAYNKIDNCSITIPKFNKIGYENKGYSTFKVSLAGFIFPNEKYTISKDVTLYPIYSLSNHISKLNINKTYVFKDSFIEIEEGCSENVYKEFLNYLQDISNNAPFLLLGNKISFLSDSSFDEIWGREYVGMNYGPRNMRSVDVRCSTRVINDYYATMVHEMTHSWDFYYATKFGNNITSQSDIINLYNKYLKSNDRPFRDYSYSSVYEFLADAMKYYYFKYYVIKNDYANLDFPSDIKTTLEKYICISRNNYDESRCK